MDREEQLKGLKRKLLDKQNKVDSMIFELREIGTLISQLLKNKESTTDIKNLNDSITSLVDKFDSLKKVEVVNISEAKTKIPEYLEFPKFPEYPDEIKVSNLKDIPVPQVHIEDKIVEFPEEFKVSNLNEIKTDFPEEIKVSNLKEIKLPDIKTEKVEFPEKINIDWENQPKIDYNNNDKIAEAIPSIGKEIKTQQKATEGFLAIFFDKVYDFFDRVVLYLKEPDKISITNTTITEWYGKKKVVYRIKDIDGNLEITNEN